MSTAQLRRQPPVDRTTSGNGSGQFTASSGSLTARIPARESAR